MKVKKTVLVYYTNFLKRCIFSCLFCHPQPATPSISIIISNASIPLEGIGPSPSHPQKGMVFENKGNFKEMIGKLSEIWDFIPLRRSMNIDCLFYEMPQALLSYSGRGRRNNFHSPSIRRLPYHHWTQFAGEQGTLSYRHTPAKSSQTRICTNLVPPSKALSWHQINLPPFPGCYFTCFLFKRRLQVRVSKHNQQSLQVSKLSFLDKIWKIWKNWVTLSSLYRNFDTILATIHNQERLKFKN